MTDTVFVTGGAGFIGSNFIHYWRTTAGDAIVNIDKLTYAGNPGNLAPIKPDASYHFVHGDIADGELLRQLYERYRPRALINFAAETHVDRSIDSSEAFIHSNIVGMHAMLEQTRHYHASLSGEARERFRLLHISTDEVYGSLGRDDAAFTEDSPYRPNSPYAASKAAADHLARAYHETYGLPVIISNCSNNYGPRQYPEKLLPMMILRALHGEALPVYGRGENVRDWLYVDDHCAAIALILGKGRPGETYNISGGCEKPNIEIVRMLCSILDDALPESKYRPHGDLITYVADRPGHDFRYAMNYSKLYNELGWQPKQTLESGLRKTVGWYLDHPDWVEALVRRGYSNQRMGSGETVLS